MYSECIQILNVISQFIFEILEKKFNFQLPLKFSLKKYIKIERFKSLKINE